MAKKVPSKGKAPSRPCVKCKKPIHPRAGECKHCHAKQPVKPKAPPAAPAPAAQSAAAAASAAVAARVPASSTTLSDVAKGFSMLAAADHVREAERLIGAQGLDLLIAHLRNRE
jgi:hypothetical protein